VPWFAHGWEDEFLRLPPVDRAIHTVHWLDQQRETVVALASEAERQQLMFIPFEGFVTDPWPFLHRLEAFLGARTTPTTHRVLKRQRCPRAILTAGRGHKRSGWKQPDPSATNDLEFRRVRDAVERRASSDAQVLLRQMCAVYEQRYPFHRSDRSA